MEYLKRAWAEIDLNCLAENYRNYKKAAGCEIMCVVKADCYGHGDRAVVPFLEKELGVTKLAVSNIEEAKRLRDMGARSDILILGYTPPEKADELKDLDIIQAVTELSYAEKLSENLRGGEVRVHIAIDTGMTRIGLHGGVEETASQAAEIANIDGIRAEGLFTHFAVADSDDESDISYTKGQIGKIKAVAERLSQMGAEIPCVHYLNSAGGIYHNDGGSAFARLGIILYGLMPNFSLPVPIKLKPVMSLKATVAQVKEIGKGEYISYGRTYCSEKPMKLATVTIGYADGYSRLLSNKGEVLIHGKRAKIVGRVCMDQLMCDVTGIDVSAGDTVTLIGQDGKEQITADELASLYGTIGYEVVCLISKRVPRVIIRGGAVVDVLQTT